jgi:Domain of unknown function (DUF5667)
MNGLASRRRRAAEFARLADLAVDRPGADVAKQLAGDEESAHLVSVTQALRELGPTAADPDPEFRARLRRRVVAKASVTGVPKPSRPAVPAPRGGRAQRLAQAGSPRLAFLAGTLAALVLISGLTLLASSRAVPGDTLYGIKRSSESLELALVHDPLDKGHRQLRFAEERLGEISTLVRRTPGSGAGSSGTLGSADTDRMLAAMVDMDRDTGEGAAIITGLAVQQRSDALLSELSSWATQQRIALSPLVDQMPPTAALRAATSLALLQSLGVRLTELHNSLGCACLQTSGHDPLGPKPCPVPCVPAPGGKPSAPNPPAGPTSGPGRASPDPVHTSPSGAGRPSGGSAPPAPSTAGPPGSVVPGTVNGTTAPLPTASILPPAIPDPACRLLGPVLCRH